MEEIKQPLEQEVLSEPTPEPTPEPIPDPTPEPIPEPIPDPIPEPIPDPTPEPEKVPKKQTFWTKTNIFALVAGTLVLVALAVGAVSLTKWIIGATMDPNALLMQDDPSLSDPAEGYLDPGDLNENPNDSEPSESEQNSVTNNRIDTAEIKKISSYTYTDESLADEYCKALVATVGDHELNGGLFQVFYWAQFGYLMNSYGEYASYLGLDATKSLAEQYYGEDVTWEQYFLELAMDEYLQYCALYDEATKRGIEPDEETKASLESITEDLETFAVQGGYESAEDYLYQVFGPGVTREDYAEYYRLFATAQLYANELQTSINLSPEEVEAFYAANATSFEQQGIQKIDRNVVNVRHILIQPEYDIDSDGDLEPDSSSDEAWAAAEQAANDTYERWKLNPTEDNFATVATDTTFDTGSAENGGLYEGVYPGQMVAEFDEWCFDTTRKPGDTEIIRTDYGYHIMYFVGEGDHTYWYACAENECKKQKFNAMLDEIFAGYSIQPYYQNVHIFDVLGTNAANAAAAEPGAGSSNEEVTE